MGAPSGIDTSVEAAVAQGTYDPVLSPNSVECRGLRLGGTVVCERSGQPLAKRDPKRTHPLLHRRMRHDLVDEMPRGLLHASRAA